MYPGVQRFSGVRVLGGDEAEKTWPAPPDCRLQLQKNRKPPDPGYLVWDNCSDYLIDKLQKLQNRAAHVITSKTYETRSCNVLKELQWQPLTERLKHKKLFLCIRLGITNCQSVQQICLISKQT
jgi:hypothetical protein